MNEKSSTEYFYYAFISYKREDEKWAKWLQNKLESYKLPSVIRKELPHLPKKLKPVFRDKTDLGAGYLEDNIKSELNFSQYLIVICSPESANSEWVGKEIEAFIRMGKEDKVIPFIVKGEPNSKNATDECFHPVLKKLGKELLGINIAELGKAKALVKVVARILSLKFDLLWNRERRRSLRHKFVAAILLLLSLLGTGYYWDYNRTKYEYYADYVDRWGIPEGVIELKDSQVEKRYRHYRFEYSQKKLRKIVYANSEGIAKDNGNSEFTERPSIQEFEYQNDKIKTIKYYNSRNKLQVSRTISGKNFDRIDFQTQEGDAAGIAANLTGISSNIFAENQGQTKSKISRYLLERNQNGYITKIKFMRNYENVKACDASGVWGYDYTLDNLGRVTQIKYLGYDEEPASNRKGIASKKYEYDGYGNIYKAEYFDQEGKLIINDMFWAIAIDRADNNGNIIEEELFGKNSKPCLHKEGYSKLTRKYDDRGNEIEEAYYGKDGKTCFLHENSESTYSEYNGNDTYLLHYLVTKLAYKYDERGNKIETKIYRKFIPDDGSESFEGSLKSISKYDDNNNETENCLYYNENTPINQAGDYFKWIRKLDKNGNEIFIQFFSTEGVPVMSGVGASIIKKEYNNEGRAINISYFDTKGQPCMNNFDYHRLITNYDGIGRESEVRFYDTKNQPCLQHGIFKIKYKYDDKGNLVEQSYFNTDGKLKNNEYGISRILFTYDNLGNGIEEAYYDADGKPCYNLGTYHKAIIKYNSRGNPTEIFYYDIKLNPMNISDLFQGGYSHEIREYDDWGHWISTTFFGKDGKRCTINQGYSKIESKYDSWGNIIEVTYFDIENKPCLAYGYFREVNKYDDNGFFIESEHYDTHGKLVNLKFQNN